MSVPDADESATILCVSIPNDLADPASPITRDVIGPDHRFRPFNPCPVNSVSTVIDAVVNDLAKKRGNSKRTLRARLLYSVTFNNGRIIFDSSSKELYNIYVCSITVIIKLDYQSRSKKHSIVRSTIAHEATSTGRTLNSVCHRSNVRSNEHISITQTLVG